MATKGISSGSDETKDNDEEQNRDFYDGEDIVEDDSASSGGDMN
jgi:hypothetical protein